MSKENFLNNLVISTFTATDGSTWIKWMVNDKCYGFVLWNEDKRDLCKSILKDVCYETYVSDLYRSYTNEDYE